ncbi:hypothetical protein An14g03860 [Aspergillus niger]|uniref:Uncharacterized protein n=2 Tax=Aspergillus niger TaxID=5061 RepID=A2R3D0_ASPNC|nr:hypothetical protein An14g03860 [Aspergillus niger]CAK46622.1 hypothetical protein An14g03860 [Aspergillus niger]
MAEEGNGKRSNWLTNYCLEQDGDALARRNPAYHCRRDIVVAFGGKNDTSILRIRHGFLFTPNWCAKSEVAKGQQLLVDTKSAGSQALMLLMELPMQALSPSEATTLGWPAENTGVWHESCSQQVISLLTGLRIRQIRAAKAGKMLDCCLGI